MVNTPRGVENGTRGEEQTNSYDCSLGSRSQKYEEHFFIEERILTPSYLAVLDLDSNTGPF